MFWALFQSFATLNFLLIGIHLYFLARKRVKSQRFFSIFWLWTFNSKSESFKSVEYFWCYKFLKVGTSFWLTRYSKHYFTCCPCFLFISPLYCSCGTDVFYIFSFYILSQMTRSRRHNSTTKSFATNHDTLGKNYFIDGRLGHLLSI